MKQITYKLKTEVNYGSEETPDIVQISTKKEILCTEEKLEANLALARAEAYNGEVTVEEVPDEPMTAEEARAKRDKLLEDTDWTQVLDAPIDASTREAYRVYRQDLRDIPEQDGFPESIIWPELPTVTKAAPDPVDTAVDTLLGGETA